jgi:hypothetical protein
MTSLPNLSDDPNFLKAVLAAGGNISRSPNLFSSQVQVNGMEKNGEVHSSTANEGDISLNEDFFLPSIAAAAAVTLSPSLGPTKVPNYYSNSNNNNKK